MLSLAESRYAWKRPAGRGDLLTPPYLENECKTHSLSKLGAIWSRPVQGTAPIVHVLAEVASID